MALSGLAVLLATSRAALAGSAPAGFAHGLPKADAIAFFWLGRFTTYQKLAHDPTGGS